MGSTEEVDTSQLAWLALTGILGASLVYFGKNSKSVLLQRVAVTVGSGLIVKCVSQSIIGGLLHTD